MRAKDVLGRKIVAVKQRRYFNRWSGTWKTSVTSLALDNGSVVVLEAQQDEDDLFVEAKVVKR